MRREQRSGRLTALPIRQLNRLRSSGWYGLVAVALAGCAPDGSTPSVDEGFLAGAGGARIFYRIVGTGPDTLIAVHGGPGAGMNAFFPDVAPIAARHTIIFYDQRGGGRSELPADTSLVEAQYHVADLEAVRHLILAAQPPVEGGFCHARLHVDVAAQQNVVEHAHAVEERQVLEGAGDAKGCDLVRRHPGDVAAVQQNAADLRRKETRDGVGQRRFSAAVRSDKTEYLPALNAQVDACQRDQSAKTALQ